MTIDLSVVEQAIVAEAIELRVRVLGLSKAPAAALEAERLGQLRRVVRVGQPIDAASARLLAQAVQDYLEAEVPPAALATGRAALAKLKG